MALFCCSIIYAVEIDFVIFSRFLNIITGPPTHSVGARLVTVAGVCRRL